jgi:DNA polymerase-3 subunit gamma/tau
MGYQVLARKYRPQRFADVAGQDHVTVTLMNALTQNRIAHGYIFSGHRGIGKTTIARILACALNCRNAIGSEVRPTAEPCLVCESCTEIRAGNAVDVIEIDAATNRGIDEIRELRDAARYRPSRDRYKIYILDEAHQITDAAFNALLKTLEEPPDHIVFMMATTQPEDIPQTVRSRCQHFSFHAVKLVDILSELRGIAEHEGVEADESALSLLAEAGDGSMRDALSIMDQAIASAPLTDGKARLDAGQIRELMGTVPNAVFERVMQAVDGNRSAEVMTVANELLNAGNSPAQLARQAVRYLRSCVMAKITGMTPESTGEGVGSELLQISPDEQRRAARTAALFTEEELTRFLQTMLRTFDELGYRQEQRFHFELGLLKLVHLKRLLPVEEVLSSLSGAGMPSRAKGASGAVQAPVVTPAPASPRAAVAAEPVKPAFSPFERDSAKRRYDGVAPGQAAHVPVVSEPVKVSEPQAVAPPPVASLPTTPIVVPEPVKVAAPVSVSSPVLVATPSVTPAAREIEEAVPSPSASSPVAADEVMGDAEATDAVALQRAVVDALIEAKQSSAADAMGDAVWTVGDGEIRVQTELSKTMLPVVLNPEAEKIAKAALRTAAGGLKLVLLAGAAKPAGEKKVKVARAGSAQAKALEHPMVQEAQKLFGAEIQTVIDLSE